MDVVLLSDGGFYMRVVNGDFVIQ